MNNSLAVVDNAMYDQRSFTTVTDPVTKVSILVDLGRYAMGAVKLSDEQGRLFS